MVAPRKRPSATNTPGRPSRGPNEGGESPAGPAAGRSRRQHIAGAVDNVEMHGVAAHGAGTIERRTVERDETRINHIVVSPGLPSDCGLARACSRHALAARDADVEPLAVAGN